MRILQILPELKVGGVETGTVDLAKYLIRHGHTAIVVSNGGDLVRDLEANGAKHYNLPVHKKFLWTIIRSIKELEKILKEEKIDIVHARSRVPAWIAFFACRRADAAFITTCHGYYRKHFFSRVMGWSKFVITPSEVIGRHMIDDFGVPAGNIRCIPRSVDLEKFNIPKDNYRSGSEKIICIIGRITPLKGHVYFLKAMAKLVRSIPYAKIWIIGDAPLKKELYRQELEILVKRLGLSSFVEFLGNRKDIPNLLARVDVLVLSTVTEEAFGRVILEAQAADVPVVATKVGGVVEIIEDGKTGLLVLPKDTDAMAQAVIKVLRDKKLAQELTQEARKKLETKFTLEHMASLTVETYKELLNSLNILVIKISSIGDVALITPSLRAIRQKYPEATISCLVGKESSVLLQRCPYIDNLIVFDPRHKDKGPFKFLKLSRRLCQYKFDKVIDLQNNQKSHLLSFLSFPRESYGYDNGKLGWLLLHRIKDSKSPMPPVKHQFQVLKILGIEYDEKMFLELWPSGQDKEYARNLLDSEWLGNNANIIGINIAASEKWTSKNWPLTHIARLCDILSEENLRVIITGVEKDKEAAKELLKLTKAKPAIFVGKTDLLQLAALIKRCKVFITPDSAPMHIAAAVGTPFIAFFGPTDPLRHMAPSKKSVVLRKDISCICCYDSYCRIPAHTCMSDIKPEEVVSHVNELMKTKR